MAFICTEQFLTKKTLLLRTQESKLVLNNTNFVLPYKIREAEKKFFLSIKKKKLNSNKNLATKLEGGGVRP